MNNKELSIEVKKVLVGEVLCQDEFKTYGTIINCDKCNSRVHYRYRRCDVFNLEPGLFTRMPCLEDVYSSALFFNHIIDGLKIYK